MKRKLDDRLLAAASLVRPGSRVADIGADHGYLICHLVEEGISPGGCACDINRMPLRKAEKAIREAGLSERIRTVQADGLQGVSPAEVDDVVIAGMGGELIWEILSGADWTRDSEKHYVLQPMTKANRLRKALCRDGYAILREEPAQAGGFCYTVLSVVYTGISTEADDFFAYCGKMPESSNPLAVKYLESVLERIILVKAKGLAKAGHEDAERYQALAERLRGKIEEMRGTGFRR